MTTTDIVVETVGWIGSVLVVTAYFLNMSGKIDAQSTLYKWLNIIGSAGLIILTLYHKAIPSAVVNIIWTVIGIAALIRTARKQPKVESKQL
ncbi:CBU_0592 family membrane protein [Xanthocytophaga agilis]|uniref:CBU-0592-like domain-containing protein n=1 Tax=Xanthocytophaga agilis TaxID=3048010 RepID=A0AAE3R2X8_9BACT|nr:hypothetical protein [Xanthocytophaga agilis]MDJ1500364.1 hypothetical protein [Xanthocytophaga agilis]